MKIAIVHDCFREYGGAERVIEAMHEMWPNAPVYTSFVDWKGLGTHALRFKNWDLRTSWVQHQLIIKKFISPLRFLIPLIWKGFDFSGFDVVITSSGWFMSRGAVKRESRIENRESKNRSVHICYIHHPPRNMYGYATGSDLQKYWIVRVYSTIVNFFLRHYDFETAQNVDYFIANSKETARRVEKFYRRDSTVIYPPIRGGEDAMIRRYEDNKQSSPPRHLVTSKQYYLSVGRLAWAKRVDLIIEVCNKLQLPLKIVGTGKEEQYLRSIAGSTIEFVGSVSDEQLQVLYKDAKALIFCALDEDFGMVPVEAMAAGTPVIALHEGGVMETVVDGETGVFFDTSDESSLIHAIRRFETLSLNKQWSDVCIKQAARFSKTEFQNQLRTFVEKSVKKGKVPH